MRWQCKRLYTYICFVVWSTLFLFSVPDIAFTNQDGGSEEVLPATEVLEKSTTTVVEGHLNNRTLYEVLVACDVPPIEILTLTRSFQPVFDFRCARPKDYYQALVDERHLIQKFVYKTGPMDEYEAIKDKNGGYQVHKREIILDRQVAAKAFTIETSLYQAVSDSGETSEIAALLAEIFAWDIDFYLYPRKGDQIAMVYERCYKDGKFITYGDILAARYVGERKAFSAFLFNDGQAKGYYDETGKPLKKMFLRIPVKFGKMTSRYSIRRFHPVSKRYKAHTGIDYGAPTGTPIFATSNGKVIFSGRKGGYGKLVIVKHPNGYQTYYGHCSKLLKNKGDFVEQGQVIARVGQTGMATGPHVHYEVRVNGKPINPNTVKKSRGNPLRSELLAEFRKIVKKRMVFVNNLLDEKTNLVMLTQENAPPLLYPNLGLYSDMELDELVKSSISCGFVKSDAGIKGN